MRLELPWPPMEVSPNKRHHWSVRAKAVKRYRADCGWVAKMQKPPTSFNFKVKFYPPDKRVRDFDNMIASFKAGQDGLADAWGVDDKIFKMHYDPEIGEPVKHGMVVISII